MGANEEEKKKKIKKLKYLAKVVFNYVNKDSNDYIYQQDLLKILSIISIYYSIQKPS